jgi:hypothetical protein
MRDLKVDELDHVSGAGCGYSKRRHYYKRRCNGGHNGENGHSKRCSNGHGYKRCAPPPKKVCAPA